MRGFGLFLRARHIGATAAICLVTFAVVAVLGVLVVQPLASSQISYALAAVAPVVIALTIGATSSSAATEAEARSVRCIPCQRAAHRGLLLVGASAGIAVALMAAGHSELLATSLRNLAGFTGIALLTAAALGPRLSWAVPVLWLSLPPVLFDSARSDSTGVWTFFAQPVDDARSAGFSALALVFGLILTIAIDPPLHALLRRPRRVETIAMTRAPSAPNDTSHSS